MELAYPMHILDVYALHVCVELQNQLLQVEERPLVSNVLPYLQAGTAVISAVDAFVNADSCTQQVSPRAHIL